jgi:hypothetical protein
MCCSLIRVPGSMQCSNSDVSDNVVVVAAAAAIIAWHTERLHTSGARGNRAWLNEAK